MASSVQFACSGKVTSVLTRAIKVTAETGENASSLASSASFQLLLSKWKNLSMTQWRIFSTGRYFSWPSTPSNSNSNKKNNNSLPGQAVKKFNKQMHQKIYSGSNSYNFTTRRYFSDDCSRSNNSGSKFNPNGALSGITVLDFTRVLAGPFCTQFLGDLGAQVIKVEEPTMGDDTRGYGPPFFADSPSGSKNSAYFVSINRNKESIGVNLKDPRGVHLIHQLASQADVVIENFTPGVADRLGIGFNSLSKVNSSLIYCSISGFGQDGVHSKRPGYDVIASSIGGLLSITGPEFGDPCRPGVPIIDLITGLYATCAILTALYNRTKSLEGQLGYTSNVADVSNRASASNYTSDSVKGNKMNNNGYSVSSDKDSNATGATCVLMNNECNKRQEEERKQDASTTTKSSPATSEGGGEGRKEEGEGVTKEKGGAGPVKIDVNLLSSQISVLINIALNYLNFNLVANRRGTAHETIVPYQAFACKADEPVNVQEDEKRKRTSNSNSNSKVVVASDRKKSTDYLTVIAGNEGMFRKLIPLVFADEPETGQKILSDDKFANNAARQTNRKELIDLLQSKFSTKSRSEWISLLANSGLPYGPVNTIDQVFSDQDIKSRTTFTVDGITYLKNAVTFQSETQFHRRDFIPPAKSIGQDTRQVLASMLHLTQNQLDQLALDGVIRL